MWMVDRERRRVPEELLTFLRAKGCCYSHHPRFAGVQECWELATCGSPVGGKSAFCLTSSQALARGWSAAKDIEADMVASGGPRG